jgi:cytochrome c oxidase subunit 4
MSTTDPHDLAASGLPEVVEDDQPIPPGPHEHAHPKDSLYVVIAVILAALTGLEIMTYYVSLGPLFLPTLLTLMSVKFLLVVLFFMHLKFDSPIFGRFFWGGLALAVAVYLAVMATFQVFTN